MSASGVPMNSDVQHWKERIEKSIDTKAWTSATNGPSARPWSNSLWSCFTPPSLCCLTCCLPCITFGKTHHRLRNNGDMTGYEPLSTSCALFCVSNYLCVPWVLNAMQLQDIRERHNLEGSCARDLLKSYCCLCCSLMQAEKESLEKQAEGAGLVQSQYVGENMVMGQQNPEAQA